MFNLHYEFNKNIPDIRCTMCGKCHDAIEAVSYVDKNRGCCWYFPKYNLFEIKNLIDNKNMDFFYNILKMKNCSISQFHVEIKGLFKVKEYARYEKKALMDEGFDKRLFFRLCPFFGKDGCTIDYTLRPYPCNLYLCRNVIKLAGGDYIHYSRERKDYASYAAYFDEALKYELLSKNTDFLSDMEKSIDVISKFDMPEYEPRKLKDIYFDIKSIKKAI